MSTPLGDPGAAQRRWLVAGTAGGVGTTTATALLFAEARTRLASVPRLLDHTAGTLGARVPPGTNRAVDDRWTLHDLGPHPDVALAAASDPGVAVLLVSAATPAGCRLAADVFEEFRTEIDTSEVSASMPAGGRIGLVLAQVYRPLRLRAELTALRKLANDRGVRGPVVLPADAALTGGGAIPSPRLAGRTIRAASSLLDLLLAPS